MSKRVTRTGMWANGNVISGRTLGGNSQSHALSKKPVLLKMISILFIFTAQLQLNACGVRATESTGSSQATTTKLTMCRERVMGLEDELDVLQSKYNRVFAEYQDQREELRAEIECQRNLEETGGLLEECRLDVEKRKDGLSRLESLLSACENKRDACLVDLRLTEASLAESMSGYHELQRQYRKDDCVSMKKDLVAYRDQAEQCIIDSEVLNNKYEALLEKVGVQEKMLVEFDGVVQASSEKDGVIEQLRGRVGVLEDKAVRLEEVEKEFVRVKGEYMSVSSALESSKNELSATKTALNSLLQSLDSHLQYEALKDAHEKELLPFWLDRILKAAVHRCSQAYSVTVKPVFKSGVTLLNEKVVYVVDGVSIGRERVSTSVAAAKRSVFDRVESIMYMYGARDAMRRASTAWNENRYSSSLTVAVERYLDVLAGFMSSCRASGYRLKFAAVGVIKHHLSQVSALQGLDIDAVSVATFYTFVTLCTLPLVALLTKTISGMVLYYLRPGSAVVVIADEAATIRAVEESIGYHFRNKDYLRQALERSPILHQVGLALINLILAKEGSNAAATMAEVESRSLSSYVVKIVTPGPGKKSRKVAKEQSIYMYICLLAAVFRDSQESVEKVSAVWTSRPTTDSESVTTKQECLHDDSIDAIESEEDVDGCSDIKEEDETIADDASSVDGSSALSDDDE